MPYCLSMADTGTDNEQQAERREKAIQAMQKVCDHLGLAGKQRETLTIRIYGAASDELGLDISSSQVVRAWGSWQDALSSLTADELPRVQDLVSGWTNGRKFRAVEEGVEAWLASDPESLNRDAYDEWARQARPTVEARGDWLPSAPSIAKLTGLQWKTVLDEVRQGCAAQAFALAKRRQGKAARTARQRAASRVQSQLGARLRVLREARGLSQAELSRRLEVPHSVIAHLERGRSNPAASTLKPLLVALDCSYDLLLMASDEEFTRKVVEIRAATAQAASAQSSSAGSSRCE